MPRPPPPGPACCPRRGTSRRRATSAASTRSKAAANSSGESAKATWSPPLGAPGRQLQRGVRADPDDRERAVLALVAEAHDFGVEAHAGLAVVDRQDEMVERHHGRPAYSPGALGRSRWIALEAGGALHHSHSRGRPQDPHRGPSRAGGTRRAGADRGRTPRSSAVPEPDPWPLRPRARPPCRRLRRASGAVARAWRRWAARWPVRACPPSPDATRSWPHRRRPSGGPTRGTARPGPASPARRRWCRGSPRGSFRAGRGRRVGSTCRPTTPSRWWRPRLAAAAG